MTTRQGNRLGRSFVVEAKAAALSGDFGVKMLRLKFPEQADKVLEELGTYSRGPRKGLPRGYIHWDKVSEGGWNYGHSSFPIGVVRPGSYNWCVSRDGISDFVNMEYVGRRYQVLDAHEETAGALLLDNVTFDMAINKGERYSDYGIRAVEDLAVGGLVRSIDGRRDLRRIV